MDYLADDGRQRDRGDGCKADADFDRPSASLADNAGGKLWPEAHEEKRRLRLKLCEMLARASNLRGGIREWMFQGYIAFMGQRSSLRMTLSPQIEIFPELTLEQTHDMAVEIARRLDGLRCDDALGVLDAAKGYALQASIAVTEGIPAKIPAGETARESRPVAAE